MGLTTLMAISDDLFNYMQQKTLASGRVLFLRNEPDGRF